VLDGEILQADGRGAEESFEQLVKGVGTMLRRA
jgi:hypothetical protein